MTRSAEPLGQLRRQGGGRSSSDGSRGAAAVSEIVARRQLPQRSSPAPAALVPTTSCAGDRLSIERAPGCLTVRGEIDAYTGPSLTEALRLQSGHVCLDLRGVEFIDCCGVGIVVAAHRRLEASGGRLVVTDISEPVRRLLDLTDTATMLGSDGCPCDDVGAPRRTRRAG